MGTVESCTTVVTFSPFSISIPIFKKKQKKKKTGRQIANGMPIKVECEQPNSERNPTRAIELNIKATERLTGFPRHNSHI